MQVTNAKVGAVRGYKSSIGFAFMSGIRQVYLVSIPFCVVR